MNWSVTVIPSQISVQKALQYENWQRMPEEMTSKILAHSDYSLLDAASGERPVPDRSALIQDCQIPRNNKTINLAYSLKRLRDDSQFDIIDADDFPQLWKKLEKNQKHGKRWITIDRLTLQSERDLHNLVCRLGLHHWIQSDTPTPVFCLELHNVDCVKPNALDAGLAFYFHQTPGQDPGRTRNLETGEPDMEEWLLEEVNGDTITCVGGLFSRQKIEVNMDNYYKNNAQRIRG